MLDLKVFVFLTVFEVAREMQKRKQRKTDIEQVYIHVIYIIIYSVCVCDRHTHTLCMYSGRVFERQSGIYFHCALVF